MLAEGKCPECGFEQPGAPRPRAPTVEETAARQEWLREQESPNKPVEAERREARRKAEVGEASGRWESELLDRAIRSSRIGFVMVCVATAAATLLLILDRADPYSDKVPLSVWVGLFLTSIVLGPVALGVLLSALSRADQSPVLVPGSYQVLGFAGLILAMVGALEVGYVIVSNLGGTL